MVFTLKIINMPPKYSLHMFIRWSQSAWHWVCEWVAWGGTAALSRSSSRGCKWICGRSGQRYYQEVEELYAVYTNATPLIYCIYIHILLFGKYFYCEYSCLLRVFVCILCMCVCVCIFPMIYIYICNTVMKYFLW